MDMSLVLVDSSVPDVDFLVHAVNKNVARILVMTPRHDVSDIIDGIEKTNCTSVVWVYADDSNICDISALLKTENLPGGFHFANLGKTSKIDPELLSSRGGVRVTESKNLFGMKHHLIRDEPVYERIRYFTELVNLYPLNQVDVDFVTNLSELFDHLDGVCKYTSKRDKIVDVLNHDVVNHVHVASRIICSILMKYQTVKHGTYDPDIVYALNEFFKNMYMLLGKSDPNFKQALKDLIDADIEGGKVYLIVAILVINYGINPKAVVSYCERYGIESSAVFIGYIRCGQVVFDTDVCNGAPWIDHCLPALKKIVAKSTVDVTRKLVLSPRTKLKIYKDYDFQGEMTIFENDSFTDDREVVAKKWRFEFASYEISVIDRDGARYTN